MLFRSGWQVELARGHDSHVPIHHARRGFLVLPRLVALVFSSSPPITVSLTPLVVRRRECPIVIVLIRSNPRAPLPTTRFSPGTSRFPDTASSSPHLHIHYRSLTMSSLPLTRNCPRPSETSTSPLLRQRSTNQSFPTSHRNPMLMIPSSSTPRSPADDFAAMAYEGKVSRWGQRIRVFALSAPLIQAPPHHLWSTPTGRRCLVLIHDFALVFTYLRYFGIPPLRRVTFLRESNAT